MGQVLSDRAGVVAVDVVAELVLVGEPELTLGTLVNGHSVSVALRVIRPQFPGDAAVVHDVHREAFGRDLEADLAGALVRDGDALPSSRLAVVDGDVVGSVVVSRAWVSNVELGDVEVVALGPVGVRPAWQRQGIGASLVRAAVAAAAEAPLVALLGDPAYYSRFGFAADPRVTAPDPAWGGAFQVLRRDPSVEGAFRYARAFGVSG